MATVRERRGKFGTTYRAEICVRGERRSATFDKRSAAYAWAEATESALRRGEALPGEAPPGDHDFVAAVDRYQAALEAKPKLSDASKRMYYFCASRLRRAFSGRTLATITRDDVERWRDKRLESVGPASIRHDYVFLRGLYRHARLEWGLDIPCPADDVPAPAPPRNREMRLSPAEITRLLDYCCDSRTPLLYSYARLLLLTGMRPSEAATLRWSQVRTTERRIELPHTKTGRPRNVPLALPAVDLLQRLRLEMHGEMLFFADPVAMPRIASDHFSSQFSRAVRRAGLAGRGITLYALRHIAASYLVMGGVDLATVREILGHTSIQTTTRYTHATDGHRLAAIERLAGLGA